MVVQALKKAAGASVPCHAGGRFCQLRHDFTLTADFMQQPEPLPMAREGICPINAKRVHSALRRTERRTAIRNPGPGTRHKGPGLTGRQRRASAIGSALFMAGLQWFQPVRVIIQALKTGHSVRRDAIGVDPVDQYPTASSRHSAPFLCFLCWFQMAAYCLRALPDHGTISNRRKQVV